MADQVTFYNANGDPVKMEDTETVRVKMKAAGFVLTDPTAKKKKKTDK